MLTQTVLEVGLTVYCYPTDAPLKGFAAVEFNAVERAEQRFRECHALSRWMICKVLDMPLETFESGV